MVGLDGRVLSANDVSFEMCGLEKVGLAEVIVRPSKNGQKTRGLDGKLGPGRKRSHSGRERGSPGDCW